MSNGEGLSAIGQEEISRMFQSFYYELFTTSNPKGIIEALAHFDLVVTEEMNMILRRESSREEIEKAIFEMNPLSSPGSDGFPVVFYQNHWSIKGNDVIGAIKEILSTKVGFEEVNKTFIALIPKKQSPKTVSDYWPICLCTK